MSKKLIASAGVVAGLAVALAPLAAFAATKNYASDTHTDTLNITVAPACSFGNVVNGAIADKGVSHAATANSDTDDAAGVWTPANDTNSDGLGLVPDRANGTAHASTDSFAYEIYAGTSRNDMATTSLKIFCNTSSGYTLKAATADLAEQNPAQGATAQNIPASTSYSNSVSGYAISKVAAPAGVTTEYGEADYSTKFAETTAGVIAYKNAAAAETGDTITMTYGIGVAPNQKATLYQGTVTYTLIQGFDE